MESLKLATPEQVGLFLYKRLEAWRIEHGYGVRDLAAKLNIAHTTYYKMSLGCAKRVNLNFVLDVAKLLGVRLDELFDPSVFGVTTEGASRSQLYSHASNQLHSVMTILHRLSRQETPH